MPDDFALSLKWNNIYWIETVTPNSGFLYPTTYNLKGNHSNNIISIIHNTYVDYCRNNILFSLINLLILIHCIRYQYLLLQIIRKTLRDHFRPRSVEDLHKDRSWCESKTFIFIFVFPITSLKWNLPPPLPLNVQFIKTTNKIEIKIYAATNPTSNSISACIINIFITTFHKNRRLFFCTTYMSTVLSLTKHIFILARKDKIRPKKKNKLNSTKPPFL